MANFARGLGLVDVEGTLNNILGTIGLSGTMLCAVPWKNLFKEVCNAISSHQRYYWQDWITSAAPFICGLCKTVLLKTERQRTNSECTMATAGIQSVQRGKSKVQVISAKSRYLGTVGCSQLILKKGKSWFFVLVTGRKKGAWRWFSCSHFTEFTMIRILK